MASLDRYNGSCIMLDDLSNRICVPNKTCKFKCLWYDNKNKGIKNISKTFYMIVNANLMVKNAM